ncbi:hypothetical protein RQM47_11595 [Rubrivirga sp. S365]|uniref:Uncharacterized protein n=1 Tax=Rubrivirga litoralis TaxID=3075598 RepID=A0ABU3BVG1_9BACT|nr:MULTISPECIES: hypothetical protein [unclassified Rubrivirga]MDT0633279.1 hypothetical protein [Rubrivirga sp. F394]MDT7857284.1 hypothetical protein [Rubrivirga sp. S365]
MRAWFLATPLSEPLAADGHAVVELLRSDRPRSEKAAQAHAFIYGVGEHALAYHLREPLERLGVGRVTRQALGVALDLALRGLRTPLRRVLDGMDEEQLRGVADEIEVRLYPDPHG